MNTLTEGSTWNSGHEDGGMITLKFRIRGDWLTNETNTNGGEALKISLVSIYLRLCSTCIFRLECENSAPVRKAGERKPAV